MNALRPTVRLGDVLTHYTEYIETPEPREYRKLSVKLYGKGVVLDAPADGSLLKMKRHQLAKAGQVILSEIWGKKGAIGFVPGEGEGALCTSHFFLFDVREDKIDSRWLKAIFDANYLQAQLDASARGTTGYAAVRSKTLLACEIPLPPLAEQRRLLARIEELTSQIHEARTLRKQAAEEIDALVVAMAHRADLETEAKANAGWQRKRLSDVVRFVDDSHKVEPDHSYPNLGIYSFGRGLFHKPTIDGLATSATTLRRVKSGQFIYSRLFAFEGAYGIVTKEFDGAFVSQEYPTFECNRHHVRAEFLAAYFKPAYIWRQVAAGSKGLGDRRQRVQPAQVLAHELWIPPIAWQNRLAEVQAEVDCVKRLQAETAAELEALLPAILDRAFKGEL